MLQRLGFDWPGSMDTRAGSALMVLSGASATHWWLDFPHQKLTLKQCFHILRQQAANSIAPLYGIVIYVANAALPRIKALAEI